MTNGTRSSCLGRTHRCHTTWRCTPTLTWTRSIMTTKSWITWLIQTPSEVTLRRTSCSPLISINRRTTPSPKTLKGRTIRTQGIKQTLPRLSLKTLTQGVLKWVSYNWDHSLRITLSMLSMKLPRLHSPTPQRLMLHSALKSKMQLYLPLLNQNLSLSSLNWTPAT